MKISPWIVTGLILFWAVGASGIGAFYYYQFSTTNEAFGNLYDAYQDLIDVHDAYQDLIDEDTIIASIGIDYGNGTIDWQNSTTIPYNATALHYTNITNTVGGTQYPFGFYVESINNVAVNTSGNEKYWIYSVNGNPVFLGADSYFLKFGDIVLWEYKGF